MFPSDWSERKTVASNKRRKIQPKDEAAVLLEECKRALGAKNGVGTLEMGRGDGGVRDMGVSTPSVADPSCEQLHNAVGVEYPSGIVDLILRRVNDSKFAPAMPEELQLDHVLSGIPYQSMLESLFGGVGSEVPDVPIVTKAYEESYMREATPGEQLCALGELCECRFIDRNAPFVGVKFELPVGCSEGPTSVGSGLCVLCCRKTTQRLFYDMCFSGKQVHGLIQQYGNLCHQPGEYARCCMLICPPTSQWQCMPRPIVAHQRNRYRVHVVAGLKHLQQLRVAYEDFVTPSDRQQD